VSVDVEQQVSKPRLQPHKRPTLANFWHPIAPSSEVTEQPKQFTLLGEQLVLYRDAEGVTAFKDVCIHRGTALSLGWVTDGRLTCAYHGWQYDRTGACVKIPSLPEGSTIPLKARAIAYTAVEKYDLVWVALDEPMRPLPGWPKDVWGNPKWRVFYASHFVWNATAGRAVENFMDFSHFPFVHPGKLGDPEKPVVYPELVDAVRETDYGFTYAFQQEEPNDLFPSGGALTKYVYHLYVPFMIHVNRIQPSGDNSIITLIAVPTAPGRTDLYLWQARDHALDSPDHLFKGFTDSVMEEDRPIVESQRPHEIPTDLRDELHLKVPDENAVAYRRELAKIDRFGEFDFLP
jgi:phenylpropionate dioxygenase-like ring-hydroxylating dioxygenase large terminal subunit